MPDHIADEQFLRHALELARDGFGLASPNPYVGAVIVDPQGNIAGAGAYTYDGLKHAEVLALTNAGEKARGGTLYINLEPHSHQGRTPPCTDALISAGVRRVVASMPDPNPQVSGRGFAKLRAAGIHVEVGRLEAEARRLNEAFARYIRHGIPLVTLKSAMTLDGKIAPPIDADSNRVTGIPRGGWITGDAARTYVQQQRHQADAIMVGIGTILADDPLLTDRSGNRRRRPLLRVILDSRLRLPLEARIVQSISDAGNANGDVLLFCCDGDARKKKELEARGVRVEKVLPGSDGRPDIHSILRHLGELEITSVMIEGGATVNGSMLASGAVDKVFLYYAPRIWGEGAVQFTMGENLFHTDGAPQVQHLRLHRFEEDFALEGYLRNPYDD